MFNVSRSAHVRACVGYAFWYWFCLYYLFLRKSLSLVDTSRYPKWQARRVYPATLFSKMRKKSLDYSLCSQSSRSNLQTFFQAYHKLVRTPVLYIYHYRATHSLLCLNGTWYCHTYIHSVSRFLKRRARGERVCVAPLHDVCVCLLGASWCVFVGVQRKKTPEC